MQDRGGDRMRREEGRRRGVDHSGGQNEGRWRGLEWHWKGEAQSNGEGDHCKGTQGSNQEGKTPRDNHGEGAQDNRNSLVGTRNLN
jgi:hypothetical protein